MAVGVNPTSLSSRTRSRSMVLSSEVDTIAPGALDSFALTLLDESPLHLRHHPQESYRQILVTSEVRRQRLELAI
jgi:hypothetical protein